MTRDHLVGLVALALHQGAEGRLADLASSPVPVHAGYMLALALASAHPEQLARLVVEVLDPVGTDGGPDDGTRSPGPVFRLHGVEATAAEVGPRSGRFGG